MPRDWPDPALVPPSGSPATSTVGYTIWRTRAVGSALIGFGLLILLVADPLDAGTVLIAIGIAGFGVTKIVTLQRRLRVGGPALARMGDLLISAQLVEPLPVAGTTFTVRQPDSDSTYVLVLHHDGREYVLSTDAWKIPGRRFVTRAGLEEALRQLGIAAFKV